MPTKKCFIASCSNTSENVPKKLFLLVPLDYERRTAWYKAANKHFVPKGTHVYCCEDHFDLENDVSNWIEYKTIGTRIRMKSNVVPHKYIHSPKQVEQPSQLTSSTRKRKLAALQPLGERLKKKFFFEDPSTSHSGFLSEYQESIQPFTDNVTVPLSPSVPSSSNVNVVPSPSGHFEIHTPNVEELYYNVQPKAKMVSKEVQTMKLRKRYKVRSQATNTDTVNMKTCATSTEPYMCNVSKTKPAKATLTDVESNGSTTSGSSSSVSSSAPSYASSSSTFVNKDIDLDIYCRKHKQVIESKSRFYLGLPKDAYFIVHMCIKFVDIQYEQVLICLKKIRLDDANTRLADDFGLSPSYIGKIFNRNIPLLAALFKQLVYWQDAEYIKAMLPIPFRYRYKRLQSILDCLEMEIEIPSDPVNQALTWSNYKKCNTVKYLISATPHGFINFVSQGYGGRASDNIIITTSGYFDMLPNNCDVMVDRGFKQIAHLVAAKNCKIVRPPSVSTFVKPSKEDVRETRRIAALRIHIERAIRRLREFYMLKRHVCVNNNYLYLYDYIVTIACGIVNVQGLLIR